MDTQGGQCQSIISTLPTTGDGLNAVRATLQQMVALARRYKSDVSTITAARNILTAAGIMDIRRQRPAAIRALQAWVKKNIAYIYDPRGLEMLQTPPRTLSMGSGDCDDQAILLATLLETVGLPAKFIAVGVYDPATPLAQVPFSHVLTAVRLNDRWLSLETIVPAAEPGYWPNDWVSALSLKV